MTKDLLFYNKCPICDSEFEVIMDEKGFVIDWRCNECSISWTLEDLEYEPIQSDLTEWLK